MATKKLKVFRGQYLVNHSSRPDPVVGERDVRTYAPVFVTTYSRQQAEEILCYYGVKKSSIVKERDLE